MNNFCTRMLALILASLVSISYAGKRPHVVRALDIHQYKGTWYELAALPVFFQKGCYCSQFTYTLESDGDLEMTHGCYKGHKSGKWSDVSASAGSHWGKHNAQFKVPYYWPFAREYWVLYVDQNYQYAIVGTPDHEYAWIMARKPSITIGQFLTLKGILKAKGYPVNKLRMMEQSCGVKQG